MGFRDLNYNQHWEQNKVQNKKFWTTKPYPQDPKVVINIKKEFPITNSRLTTPSKRNPP